MQFYCSELVKANPYIDACAIAFEPYYYKELGQYFMAYAHLGNKSNGLELNEKPATQDGVPYTKREWYAKAVEKGFPCWTHSKQEEKGDTVITFSIPIDDGQRTVGVLAVNVSQRLLSDIVLQAKPSANSFTTMISSDGSFIVHPDSNKLYYQNALELNSTGSSSQSVKEAVQAMVSGQTDYKEISLNGQNCYVFFKPFRRLPAPRRYIEELGWSVGIIYPEEDIFGDYNNLLLFTLAISISGLLLVLVIGYWFIRRRLQPLHMLTESAQRISQGHFNEPIPDSRQQDEVGRLQDHFQQMQQALATHMSSLEKLTSQLKQQGTELNNAYERAKEADRMKTAFLHNMSDQMIAPVVSIVDDVNLLHEHQLNVAPEKAGPAVSDIQKQGMRVTELLNDLLTMSNDKSMEVTRTPKIQDSNNS